MKATIFKKIVWAVDIIDSPELQKPTLLALAALAQPSHAKIAPVYILSSPYAHLYDPEASVFEEAFQALAEKRMVELGKHATIQNLLEGKILISRGNSIVKDVRRLTDYAASIEGDVIVVATHARRAVARLFMGSFAETLAIHSPISVITVNPHTTVRERIARILMPTTFESGHREDFERIVSLAKTLNAELTLFYKEGPTPLYLTSPEYFSIVASEAIKRAKVAEEWKNWSVQNGVATKVELQDDPGHLVGAIESYAEENKTDLIAIAPLGGSAARQIIRQAPCPVLIMKTPAPEEEF